jgi:hypothetical protein
MDIWSDPNLRLYMAVTAHWLEAVSENGREELRLQSGLIGFASMPMHHTGEHIATAFHHIISRVQIVSKVIAHIISKIIHY